ncbi:glycosyltransferase [Desulfotomaculum copahuensis]|uniref:Glycosyltransferase n=1 Tax=Desulfotomaculum copahuensis TaxID=1838280 RepID=A0A1B7LI40_9FIRM|nr:glycosyltransferase [Desulfotomaculum copahuensis]OAT86068.1 hypothetical protein A6M21_16975 [Desulfotomaculum copahuensis]
MQLWFLTTEYPPFYGGGIGTYMQHATRMFARAGHDVTVILPGDEDGVEHPEDRIEVVRFRRGDMFLGSEVLPDTEPDGHPAFPHNVMSHWPALSYQFADAVQKLLATGGSPGLIEVQDYGGIGYYLLQKKWLGYAGLAEIPLIVHLHTPTFEILALDQYPDCRLPEYWVGQMEKFCITAADGLLCPSRFLRGRILQAMTNGESGPDIEVMPLPFEFPATGEAGAELNEAEKTFVYVGRLELRKGVLPLLECCERLWEAGERFTLLMVGGDTDFYTRGVTVGEYLRRRYRRRLEDGRLQFAGKVPPDECARLVARAWAVLVPSLYENFPLTCVEAMHAGKLVIGSSAGGQAEMIGGEECGEVFDWAVDGALESALRKVLRMPAGEVAAAGARARERIMEMTAYRNVLARRMDFYERIKRRGREARLFPAVNRFDRRWTPSRPAPAPAGEPGLLSVVIPFYNMGRYIEETVQSALASTYRPLEIVVVDDGSDDPESLAVLEALPSSLPDPVRVVHTPNRGLAAARNTGAENARGEYLALLDADDLVEPEFYARCVEILRRYDNISLVYSWVRFFDSAKGCFIANNLEFPYLLAHNMLAAICVLKRSDFLAFARNKPRLSAGLEDYESWISLYEAGRLGVCIPEFLTRYRVRRDSMLRGMNDHAVLFMYDEIVRLHAATYRRYGDELFRLLNTNGASFAWNSPGDNWQSAERRVRWLEERLRQVEEEAQTLRSGGAAPCFADPAEMGVKMALWTLVRALRRKVKKILFRPN